MRSIIVIGHARSGTSLTAGILHELGVDMGDKRVWRKPDEANEKGYFENSQFVRANQAMLEKKTSPDLQAVVNKNSGELWGAKDPRFLATWEEWEPYIENPMFVVCHRDWKSITDSVCARDNGKYGPEKTPQEVSESLNKYYSMIPKIEKYPRMFIQYENYFKNDNNVMNLAMFVGVPYKEVTLPDANLKHF